MKLHISIEERNGWINGWISAVVEDHDGSLLGTSTAPVVEGATFDVRAAVIREAIENALRAIAPAP